MMHWLVLWLATGWYVFAAVGKIDWERFGFRDMLKEAAFAWVLGALPGVLMLHALIHIIRGA